MVLSSQGHKHYECTEDSSGDEKGQVKERPTHLFIELHLLGVYHLVGQKSVPDFSHNADIISML
jgi:hypothetical protein